MFSLAQGFYRELTYVPERRVVLLGLGCAGKSSVLEWLKLPSRTVAPPASLAKMAPTVGLNVHTVHLPGQRLLIWDLGGDAKLRPIWEPYIRQADAVIWVVDCADPDSIDVSTNALRDVVSRPHLAHRPLLILANKQDLSDALDSITLALRLDVPAAADLRSQCVQPISAATGAGIHDALNWLAEQLRTPQKPSSYKTCIK